MLAGERYMAADGSLAVASGPRTAAPVYTLNEDPARAAAALPQTDGGAFCATLCVFAPTASPPTDADPHDWLIKAHVVFGWRYATADGQPAGEFTEPATADAPLDDLITLGVQWDGGWRAAFRGVQASDLLCALVGNFAAVVLPAGEGGPGLVGPSLYAPPPPLVRAEGCELAYAPAVVGAAPTPSSAAIVLYRFGVLLAANDVARAAFPFLPAADADEQALAQAIQPIS
jgi:hypothetical protein